MLAIRDGGARIATEVIPNIATLLSDKELWEPEAENAGEMD